MTVGEFITPLEPQFFFFSVQWGFCINLEQCSREINKKMLLRDQCSAWCMATSKPIDSFALRSPIFCNWQVNRRAGRLAPYRWSVGIRFFWYLHGGHHLHGHGKGH